MLTTNSHGGGAEEYLTCAPADVHRHKELEVAEEIAHAFLAAAHPLEACRLALARLTPLVGARFSSIYLRDEADPELLRLHCAHNWPQHSARYLGQLRIRDSHGPTGWAAASGTPVEVPDVFADSSLEEWHEPARELGFIATISLPLHADRFARARRADANGSGAHSERRGAETSGALSFYFAEPRKFGDSERRLLMLVADQLAAVAEKGRLAEDLKRTVERLDAMNAELQRRLTEFESARRLKGEFLASVTHELRTPLTSILGYSHLLGEGLLGELSEKQREAVARIEVSGRAMLRLVTDLIDLSQVKAGQLKANVRAEDAVMLARRALDEAGPPREGVRCELRAVDTGIIVTTDGEKVIRILAHLLRNAIEFTAQGSVTLGVALTSRYDVPWVEWAVADTGPGMSSEDLELIFDEFRQIDGSATRAHGGAGLGLALARRMAHLVGGEIGVESEMGVGSCFVLRVPQSSTER